MEPVIIIAVLMVLLVGLFAVLLTMWVRSVRKKLVIMDENIKNAMGQIGVQLASRFDVLSVLLTLVKGYAGCEAVGLMNTLSVQRNDITSISTPKDVLGQEGLISEALNRVVVIAERYPELKADANYSMCMNAADGYKKMVQTSSLIYNDSVARLNKMIGRTPNALIAGLFGVHRKEYLNFQ